MVKIMEIKDSYPKTKRWIVGVVFNKYIPDMILTMENGKLFFNINNDFLDSDIFHFS